MNKGDSETEIRDVLDNGYMQALTEEMFKLIPFMFVIMLSLLGIMIIFQLINWLLESLNPYRTSKEEGYEENE